MRYAIHHPDGSPYDRLTLEEIKKAFKKGRITKDYLVQENDRGSWQRLGVILGLERQEEDQGTGGSVAQPAVPPPSPPRSHAMTREQNRGRWFLLVPLVAFLALDVSFTALEILRAELTGLFAVLVPSAVRIFLSVVLMTAVWTGIRWARCVLVALLLGVGVYCAYSASFHFSLLLMFLAGVYLIGGVLIGFSKSVSSFLTFQRQRK